MSNETVAPIVTPKRKLIILTGPPGAGKLDYALSKYPEDAIYAPELGNKSLWRDSVTPLTVFITSAPEHSAKKYWCSEATRYGFIPKVVVYTSSRDEAADALIARERVPPIERQRIRLRKRVSRWYSSYEEFPHEVIVNAPRKQSIPKTA